MRALVALVTVVLIALLTWGGMRWSSSIEDTAAVSAARPKAPAQLDGPVDVDAPEVDPGSAPTSARSEAGADVEPPSGDGRAEQEEPDAREPGWVRARLVDGSGLPVVGGELSRPVPDGSFPPAVSDDEGVALLELPGNMLGTWQGTAYAMGFTISASGFATQHLRIAVPAGEVTDLGDVALPPGSTVRGRVLDDDGAPVTGAKVVITTPGLRASASEARLRGPAGDGADQLNSTSDGEGRYAVEGVPLGPARAWAKSAGGAWSFSEPFEVASSADTLAPDVVMAPLDSSQMIAGRVIGPAGEVLANALVVAQASVSGPITSTRTRSDDDGRFELAALADAAHTLKAFDGENLLRPATLAGVRSGEDDLELRLEERRYLLVRVTDAETGAPIEGPWVHLENYRSAFWIGDVPRDRPSEESPGVMKASIPEGDFMVSVSAAGYGGFDSELINAESAPAELEAKLQRQARLRGVVTADGSPVEGAWVQVLQVMGPEFPMVTQGFRSRLFMGGRPQSLTDAEGRFDLAVEDLPGVAQGRALLAGKDGWATTEIEIEVPEGGLDGVELSLTPGGTLVGNVLLPDGRSPQGAVVAASRGDGRVQEARADAEGRYRFEHLTPGPWQVKYRSESAEMVLGVARKPFDGPYTGDCEILEGRTTEHDLDERGSLTECRGRLTLDGEGAAGWSARFEPALPWGWEEDGPTAQLDGQGRFVLQVRAERARLVLESTVGDTHLTLRREYDLSGELLAPELDLMTGSLGGSAPSGTSVSVRVEDLQGFGFEATVKSNAQGEYEFDRVPAGQAALRRRETSPEGWTGWVEGPTVEVVAGTDAKADF